jgi:hypothetical protein
MIEPPATGASTHRRGNDLLRVSRGPDYLPDCEPRWHTRNELPNGQVDGNQPGTMEKDVWQMIPLWLQIALVAAFALALLLAVLTAE